MQRYIVQRLFQTVLAAIFVVTVAFLLARLSGDPTWLLVPENATPEDVQWVRQDLGLDQPIYVQYWVFMGKLARGDLGEAFRWGRPVAEVVLSRLPNTLMLAGGAMGIAIVIGVPTGMLAAVKRDRAFDRFGKLVALLGQAIPGFWLGLMLILVFGVTFRLFPAGGPGGLDHLVLPAFSLGMVFVAAVMRLTRSAMLDVLDSEYVKMLRVKGMSEVVVVCKHGAKNAAIPVLTYSVAQFGHLLSGAVVIETVFAWPGMGMLVVDAVFGREYNIIQGVVLIGSLGLLLLNLGVDVLYAYLDPRIRY